jgi:glycerophosphoryl diester phosphodiesterase
MFVFAHRGASFDAPENTLEAFDEAVRQGAHGIELDVVQVEDEFFVFHDRWLERKTNGSGLITQQTKHYIRNLETGNGQLIPSLQQALSQIGTQCQINIELKWITHVSLFCQKLAQISSQEQLKQIVVSSFNHELIHEFQQHMPNVRFSLVTASYRQEELSYAVKLCAWGIHQDMDIVDKNYVEQAHKLGLKIMVYTTDRQEDWQILKNLGVDGIFTNKPKLCIAHLI